MGAWGPKQALRSECPKSLQAMRILRGHFDREDAPGRKDESGISAFQTLALLKACYLDQSHMEGAKAIVDAIKEEGTA